MTNAVATITTSHAEPRTSEAYLGALRTLIAKEPRRETLLRVARQEFATHGFLATTLSQIAQLAGIRKSTIFHYFPTKEAIYEGAVTHKLNELADAIDARAAASESAVLRIDAIVDALALAFAHEKPIGRLFLRTMIEEPVAAAAQVQEKRSATDRIVRTIAAAIRTGVDEGQIPRCVPMQEATSIVCVVCASSAAMTPPSPGAGAPEEIDEPVLIGVSDAQRAAAIAAQVRALLRIHS